MKKIISLTLAALMLVTLLLTVTSCEVSMEGTTGYTRLRDHVIDTVGQNNELALDGSAMGFSAVRLVAPIKKSETKVNEVYLVADGGSQNTLFRLTLKLTDSTEKAQLTYQVINWLIIMLFAVKDTLPLGVEPILFGVFTVAWDSLFLKMKQVFSDIVKDAKRQARGR